MVEVGERMLLKGILTEYRIFRLFSSLILQVLLPLANVALIDYILEFIYNCTESLCLLLLDCSNQGHLCSSAAFLSVFHHFFLVLDRYN